MTWYRRRIYAVTTEEERTAVLYFQRVFSLPLTGQLDTETKAKIRGVQLIFGLDVTGILDDATAAQVDLIYPEGA